MKNIPKGWEVKELKDITEFLTCGVAKRPEYVDKENGIPFLSSKNAKTNRMILNNYNYVSKEAYKTLTKYYKPTKGDILYTRVGSFGEAVVVNVDFDFAIFVSLTIMRVKPEIINNHYLSNLLNSAYVKQVANEKARGIGVRNLNVSDVRKYLIPIPPLKQQEKIIKVLDISSSLIEKQKELIENYDLFLKSKFIEMFGNIKNNSFNFDIEPISKFGKIITGNTPPRKELKNYDENYIEWIKTDNISTNKLYISKAKEYLSKVGMSKGRVLEKNGLLITCIAGSIKSIANVAMTDRKITFNQQINAIQPNEDIDPLYLYWLIKLNKNYILTFATSSMKKMISKGVFQEIPFIKPPIDLQNQFSEIASTIETIKEKENKKLKHLEDLHNSLMQKAFKGEIE